MLEQQGVIVRNPDSSHYQKDLNIVKGFLKQFEYYESLNKQVFENQISDDYLHVLKLYSTSRSLSSNNNEKVQNLLEAYRCSIKILQCGSNHNIERLSTFARIAFDVGERAIGVNIVTSIINQVGTQLNILVKEPILPANSKYDDIKPKGNIEEWLFASILEAFIINHAFSSYFTGNNSLSAIEQLDRYGYMNDEIKRRYDVMKRKFQ